MASATASASASSASSGDMSADLNKLLQQLQKSVLDGQAARKPDAASASDDEYPSDIDAGEDQDDEMMFEESELQDMMKEAAKVHVSRWTAGISGGLGATLGASGLGASASGRGRGASSALGTSTSMGGSALVAAGPSLRQLSRAQSATKEMLSAPTLLKQLEGVFTELDTISSAEAAAAVIPSSPRVRIVCMAGLLEACV